MPLEGQAERLNTPLRPRDRQVLLVLAVITVLAVIAGSVYALTRPSAPEGVNCISFTVPESVGGSSVHHCDADAKHYCRVDAIEHQAVAACRQAGFAVGTKP
jgi:hypothetical protein